MERLRYRSTSLVDLQAELRERELMGSVTGLPGRPIRPRRRTVFGLRSAWHRLLGGFGS